MSAANRRRGADAERSVVAYLRAQGWPDARRYLAGDGRQPGDIDWHPLVCLEVKDRESSSWPSWCRQAAAEAPRGTVPAVVRRTRGVTDPGRWECRVRRWEWVTVLGHDKWDLRTPWKLVIDDTGDEWPWMVLTLADLVAAVREVDA